MKFFKILYKTRIVRLPLFLRSNLNNLPWLPSLSKEAVGGGESQQSRLGHPQGELENFAEFGHVASLIPEREQGVARAFVDTLVARPRLCDLYSAIYSVMERNVSPTAVVDFKIEFHERVFGSSESIRSATRSSNTACVRSTRAFSSSRRARRT